MVIGIDNSPLVSSDSKIRGTGFYIKNLIDALQKYHPEHTYVFFTQKELLPKADVYHYPYFEPFFFSLPSNLPEKTVVTIHDLTPLVFPKLFPVGIKGKFKFAIQKRRVKRASAIITDSDSSKKDIVRLLGVKADMVFNVPLAAGEDFKKLESENWKLELKKKYSLPDHFFLYVGDATPNKNLKRLVDAALFLDLPLVMVGGALTKQVANADHVWNKDVIYVQKKVSEGKNISLLGFVSDEDLVRLYNVADVFVFPSLYEGFGLPVLEAAACGCPVVAGNGGSLTEVMGDSALYVDPYSVEDMADKMLQMFNDKKMQDKYSKLGSAQSKKFSWEKTATDTVRIYEEVFKKT